MGPSEAEREVAAASAAPDAATTETPPVRQASALRPPPARPEPAPRERSEPAPAAEPTPAPAQSTRLAAIDDRFRVQLAAVREEADARRAWDLFVVDLGPVLRDVQPFFERAETANGVFYRVQIGPFATSKRRRACATSSSSVMPAASSSVAEQARPVTAAIVGVAGPSLGAEERRLIQAGNPWGFILFARNCADPDQVRALVADLRASVGRPDAPVLIDQEGGRVARLGPPHWPPRPPARRLGRLAERDRERRA